MFPFYAAVPSGLVTKRVTVSGVGKPLSPERSRMLLALRINVLAKGYSGISLETLQQVIEAFNGKKLFKENRHFLLCFFLFFPPSNCFVKGCSSMGQATDVGLSTRLL